MARTSKHDRCWHPSAFRQKGAANPRKPDYIHSSWPAMSHNPPPRTNPGHALQSISTTAGHQARDRKVLGSAPLLCPHASTVALAFFMALLTARPFIAAFITLLAFFAFFIAAFIAAPFMAAFFMAPPFFIAAALFMAAMMHPC